MKFFNALIFCKQKIAIIVRMDECCLNRGNKIVIQGEKIVRAKNTFFNI